MRWTGQKFQRCLARCRRANFRDCTPLEIITPRNERMTFRMSGFETQRQGWRVCSLHAFEPEFIETPPRRSFLSRGTCALPFFFFLFFFDYCDSARLAGSLAVRRECQQRTEASTTLVEWTTTWQSERWPNWKPISRLLSTETRIRTYPWRYWTKLRFSCVAKRGFSRKFSAVMRTSLLSSTGETLNTRSLNYNLDPGSSSRVERCIIFGKQGSA